MGALSFSRTLGSWVASLIATGVVFGIGGILLAFLMLLMNGFSERAALPVFLCLGLVLVLANVTAVAFATWMVLNGQTDKRTVRTRMALQSVAFTTLPFLAVKAFFLGGGSL